MTAVAHTPNLGKLALRTLLLLPLCLVAWYFSADYHAIIAGGLTHMLLDLVTPGLVSSLEYLETNLAFVTRLKVYPEPGKVGILVPEVNTMLYTYGLAFFTALMLAAQSKWSKILLGIIILLPFQSWGITFDFLVQISIKSGPDVAAQAGVFGWYRDAIALCYQIGNLIFPTLIPVVLWVNFNRAFIQSLLSAQSHTSYLQKP